MEIDARKKEEEYVIPTECRWLEGVGGEELMENISRMLY